MAYSNELSAKIESGRKSVRKNFATRIVGNVSRIFVRERMLLFFFFSQRGIAGAAAAARGSTEAREKYRLVFIVLVKFLIRNMRARARISA